MKFVKPELVFLGLRNARALWAKGEWSRGRHPFTTRIKKLLHYHGTRAVFCSGE